MTVLYVSSYLHSSTVDVFINVFIFQSKQLAEGGVEEEEEEGPLDLSWPDGCLERIFYVIKAPLVFLMCITIPDVRRPVS